MKNNTLLFVGLGVLALVLIPNIVSGKGGFDLSYLNDEYDSNDVQRLQELANELSQRGLSELQIKMMLAQALHETGLFTSLPNYNAMDVKHNYAGISRNGQISAYNSLSDFVTDWLRVLSLPGAYPIQANDIVDFNNRLKKNGYYEDDKSVYANRLYGYFNLLN